MWIRCDSDYYASDIQKIAEVLGVKPVWVKARCEHGRSSNQGCIQCENGYVDDTHRFAATHSLPAHDQHLDQSRYSSNYKYSQHELLIGVSDDGDDVCYISRKHQSKVLEHNDEIQAIYSDTRAGGRA